ncbi:pyridoxine 5'-phosphate synthase-like [Ylistrum balloti]|uniref:pyridoxine 5'-phosphate synthase-like n=1 Tax=Ylistrum balloti TaxID=509963 RepID=UPI0029058D29|nr:pyridoxine 5'-phosphate synthase-like [Ylistrum balloti]
MMLTRIRLGVNVDHVATLREARKISEPDPVQAAIFAEQAGADQITVHLREDRRHIQERDVMLLREVLHVPLNLEMAPTQEMVHFALKVKPDIVTLVPERREEVTTEGGLDISRNKDILSRITNHLGDAGIQTAVFIAPDLQQIKEAKRIGVSAIELHTGEYANTRTHAERDRRLNILKEACRAAARVSLQVHAGHGLNLHNIALLAQIPELEEVNIGHSIVGRAIFVGFTKAIQEMRTALDLYRHT